MSILNKFELNDKTAIVTGAARGLGKAMAAGLAEAGARIIIPDLNLEGARSAAEEIAEIGVETLALKTDVTEEDDVKEMVKRVEEEFGKIDILINNAGICKHIPAEDMSLQEWQDVIDVNLNGVFICAQKVGKHMIENGGGSIINVSSMSAYIVNYPQCQASYNASKAGVSHLTKSLAAEWAEHNIRVNAIAPGYMRTNMTQEVIDESPELTKYWVDPTPMQRMGEPEELQGTVVYLASEASSFMTGNIMIIDGGYTIY